MKRRHKLLQSLQSSGIEKWSKKTSPGLLGLVTGFYVLLNTVACIVWTPICFIVAIPIFLLFLTAWGLKLYHWHRHQKLEEDKITEEIKAIINEEQRKQEKHKSELLQGEKTADAQIEIAKQIVQTLMENTEISEVSIGNNPTLGNDFLVKVAKREDQTKAPSKIRQMNDR